MIIEWNKVTWYSKLAAVILFVGVFYLGFYLGKEFGKTSPQVSDRQEMIHMRGAHVMSFDLNKTKHFFKKISDGGLETVLALNSKDSNQIVLIQMHLQEEVEKFSRGDFSDPAFLHDMMMPGLTELRNNFSKIEFTYRALPDGAEIKYTTKDTKLINAIHQYFDAQVSDHGSDAVGY